MTGAPLILQIQQAAIDSSASLTDALRKAKLACAKLGLLDFGRWVDLEINGYPDIPASEFPDYRIFVGTPQSLNPYRGWMDIGFKSQEAFDAIAKVPCSSAIAILENQFRGADADGCFVFQYDIDVQNQIQKWTGHNWQVRNKIDITALQLALETVRNILTDWTIKLEEQGVLGEGLMFSPDDKKASAEATAGVVNHFHMNQVGAFVQNATHSVVQGGVGSTLNMSDVAALVDQIASQKDNLPPDAWQEIEPKLDEIKQELAGKKDPGKITKALKFIGDVTTKIGTSVAASGITHMIGQMVANAPT